MFKSKIGHLLFFITVLTTLWFTCSKRLSNYSAIQCFDYEHNCTKFYRSTCLNNRISVNLKINRSSHPEHGKNTT